MFALLFFVIFLGHSFILLKKPHLRRYGYMTALLLMALGGITSLAVADMVPDLGRMLAVIWTGTCMAAVLLAEFWVFCMQRRKK